MRQSAVTLAIGAILAGVYTNGLQADSSKIDIMFYNVYNLFDAQHDEGKDDWTFLPKDHPGKEEYCATVSNDGYRKECYESNWTEKSVKIKIAQLADAIRDANKEGLPNLIGLCEVENDHVVGLLAKELGYDNYVVTDSPDQRGIDVALIYRESKDLKFQGMEEHVIRMQGRNSHPTRNVLEAEFKVGSETLSLFVNHWPSQSSPSEVRLAVAKQVKEIVDHRMQLDSKRNILLMGDFNTIDTDYPHPLKSVLTEPSSRNPLLDIHDLFLRSNAPRGVKNKLPYGTYFYAPRMSWDRLDRFFVNGRLTDKRGLEVDSASYRILTPERIRETARFDNPAYYSHGTTVAGVPFRANINANSRRNAGYSDHFPIFVRLTK